jgi:bacteriocin-like protein
MKTDKKKNKESFKHVELTKEELRTIEGGDIINPPIGPIGGPRSAQ